MKLYWRLSSLPELGHLTPDQRRRLIRRHVGRWWPRMLARSLALGFIGAVLLVFMLGMVGALADATGPLFVGGFCTLCTAASVFLYQIQMRAIRVDLHRFLKRAFHDGGLPVCLCCGYDLRGIERPTCPECGASVRWDAAGQAGSGAVPASTRDRGHA
jgi:hypothetical protein